MTLWKRWIMALCLVALLCWCAAAFGDGQPQQPAVLDNFEKDATTQQQSEQPEQPEHKHDDSDDDISTTTDDQDNASCFQVFKAIFELAGYSGALSWNRVSSPEKTLAEGFAPRKTGDPLLPFARLDFDARPVSNDIQADDFFAEAGFGPLGIQYGQTDYQEVNPLDTLKITQCYGLYRMSLGSSCEMDLGVGQMTLDGDIHATQSAFTVPILVHPRHSRLGLEFHPAWTSTISDYDLAALYSWRYTSLKLGYRWVDSPNDSLKRPLHRHVSAVVT